MYILLNLFTIPHPHRALQWIYLLSIRDLIWPLLQSVWRRTAKIAAVNQTNVSNAKLATKRTRRDDVVCLPTITQMEFHMPV